jgi:hypothetical protein
MLRRRLFVSVVAAGAAIVSLAQPVISQRRQPDFQWPTGVTRWNATAADLDGDGASELVVTTLDRAKFNELTVKTPLYVFGVANEKVVDRSAELLDGAPTSWNATLAAGDFDANGALDIMICDRGRNVGPNPPAGALVDGTRAAQNEILLNRDGKLRLTGAFPRLVTSSWGCSAGDIDRSGRASIALMDWYSDKGHDTAFVLTWDMASRLVQTHTLQQRGGAKSFGATATADFDGNGYADIAGASQLFLAGATGLAAPKTLDESSIEKAGYPFSRTTATGDFTGDGLQDVIRVNCKPEPSLSEARFAMYRGDRSAGLVEKADAFPALGSYNGTDFGQAVVPIDLDFDGDLDLATQGAVYTSFGDAPRPPWAVWLNDGTGRFQLAHWSDAVQSFPTCDSSEAFFLPSKDQQSYSIIVGGCSLGYVARTVTSQRPLTFTP